MPDNFICFFLTGRPVDFNQSAPLYVLIPNSDIEAFMPVYINLVSMYVNGVHVDDFAF